MIKRTLHFGNTTYLSLKNEQLVIDLKDSGTIKTVPIEDIGVVILEHPQITITHNLISALIEKNVAIVTSGSGRMPTGIHLPLEGHSTQTERFRTQIEASLPLKKNLWQQTIQAKIFNQSKLLQLKGVNIENMNYWIRNTKSGDSGNHEARAAAYYWANLFSPELEFRRGRHEGPPNQLLNYGYAILRSMVARSLVGSGMLPSIGLHHRNKYNAFCLADDIMEPYRPYVDRIVSDIVSSGSPYIEITKESKVELLKIGQVDVLIDGQSSPLFVAIQRTTASLYRCFELTQRKIAYPVLEL